MYFPKKTNIFSANQLGFRSGIHTESAVLNFVRDIANNTNIGEKVSGLFIDVNKAFDTVNHEILSEKLYNCRI